MKLGIFGIVAAAGLAALVSGCGNKCKGNQNKTPSIYLIEQGTTRFGMDYDKFYSEQLPGVYLDYKSDKVVDWIFPTFDISHRRGEEGTEQMFEDADRELAAYKENNP